jgi:two-component system sensor histidine kinase ArlS
LKLQVKLVLYNAISKAVIILAIGAFLPLLIQRVVYNHIDKRLVARLDKTLMMVEKGGLNEITLDQDCSFDNYNIFKEEFVSISPLPRIPIDFGKIKIENSERAIDNEFVRHRVLTKAFIYDNQLYVIAIGEGLSAVDQLNATIRKFIFLLMIAVILFSVFLDLLFARLLLIPFNKIVKEKLKDVQHPASFDPKPIITTTYEFTHLDRSINEMMRQIRETFEIEREFIMNVSHELLTPISILRNRIENMISDPTLPHDVAVKMVESQKTLSRLTKIVKSLLYISKIENEQFLKNENVSPQHLIEEVLEELDEWIQTKEITVIKEWKDDFIYTPCNKSLLHTLFYNILTNAIKYNKPDGKIYISGELIDKIYVLKIRDTGPGISSEQLPYIFDRFKRFGPADEKSYGLGLPIVKTIAAFHNIDVEVESELNIGSTFKIKFPVSNTF